MPKEEVTLYSIGDDKLTAIADAIRSQTDTEELMTTDDMVSKIENMLAATKLWIGKGIAGDVIGEDEWIKVVDEYEDGEFAMFEVEDPFPDSEDPMFNPDEQIIYLPGIVVDNGGEEEIEEYVPCAGVVYRKRGQNIFAGSDAVGVHITFTNEEDENDPLNQYTFNGTQDGDSYNFMWYDEGDPEPHYEIVIDKPVSETTYTVRMWADIWEDNDFDIEDNMTEILECHVTIPAKER